MYTSSLLTSSDRPSRLAMAIQQRSKQTSIMLTSRILQFVKQLRRRVKPRVLDGSIDASPLGSKLGPSVRSITHDLTRISVRDAKQSRRVANRICKRQKGAKLIRSSRKLQRPGSAAPASRNLGNEVQQYVYGSFCLVSTTEPAGLVCFAMSTASSTLRETRSRLLRATTSSFSNTTMRRSMRLVP